jgi:hypothetical protein
MTNLSPAAQAVLDAANTRNSYGPDDCLNESRWIVAAALCAVTDQWKNEIRKQPSTEFINGIKNCIDALNEIANELKDYQ